MAFTRDIRLTDMEIIALRDLCKARTRELEKRLGRSSYEGKPGMKDAVLTELSRVRELATTFEHAREQIARQFAAKIEASRIPQRLEYLRSQIQAERISYAEIAELQDLAKHIAKDDVELLQWAGVPEFPEDH